MTAPSDNDEAIAAPPTLPSDTTTHPICKNRFGKHGANTAARSPSFVDPGGETIRVRRNPHKHHDLSAANTSGILGFRPHLVADKLGFRSEASNSTSAETTILAAPFRFGGVRLGSNRFP